jgi:hypothetical protein
MIQKVTYLLLLDGINTKIAGWSQHSLDGYNLSNKQANISKERALLEAINDKMRRQESEIISAFQNEQQTFEDLWSEIERLRSLACWRPLKFEHSDIEVYFW